MNTFEVHTDQGRHIVSEKDLTRLRLFDLIYYDKKSNKFLSYLNTSSNMIFAFLSHFPKE
jgi:hypothetical protein